MAERPVDIRHVTKRFGDLAAVADLTFALEPGTITGFLGPNGAGKSTTLRMIGGLLRPTAGSVELFGIRPETPGLADHSATCPRIRPFSPISPAGTT